MIYKRMPGAELLAETTARQLETNTRALQSDRRENAVAPISVNTLRLVPMRGQKENGVIKVEATVTSKDRKYNPIVVFEDVVFEDEDRPDNISFTGPGKQEHHMLPISLGKNDVQVRCDCLDFYYTFAAWNNTDGSLYGDPPPPYERKTTTRPPRNPTHNPGMCKHILRVIEALRNEGVVKD